MNATDYDTQLASLQSTEDSTSADLLVKQEALQEAALNYCAAKDANSAAIQAKDDFIASNTRDTNTIPASLLIDFTTSSGYPNVGGELAFAGLDFQFDASGASGMNTGSFTDGASLVAAVIDVISKANDGNFAAAYTIVSTVNDGQVLITAKTLDSAQNIEVTTNTTGATITNTQAN